MEKKELKKIIKGLREVNKVVNSEDSYYINITIEILKDVINGTQAKEELF